MFPASIYSRDRTYLNSFNYSVIYNLNNMASSQHNADKENLPRTRIPVPKNPLPALPKHLLGVSKPEKNKPEMSHRRALKTLNTQSPGIAKAGPSKYPLNIDKKHVTFRQRNVDLDWHYTAFNDNGAACKDASIISISDDESDLENKNRQRYFVENKKKNTPGAVLRAVTPNPVRKIKGILKRPHSRELQSISPTVIAEPEKLDDKVTRLKFNESINDGLRTPDFWKSSYNRCFNRDYTLDVFEYLLANERKPLQLPRTSSTTRACVINWLMKVNGADGNPAIIQSACWYLDSILGTSHIELDVLQLFAAACFWIAQKLDGPSVSAMKLVGYSRPAFTADELLVAEKTVLNRLKFPKQPIVPQEYITYLSWLCDPHNAGDIEVAATFLAMCGLMVDQMLCDEYPSVIAVASVKNPLLLLKKSEFMTRLHTSNVFKAAEKKTANLPYICLILRQAARTMSAPMYEYKAPLEHYDIPPCCVAQRIIFAAKDLSIMDARKIKLV